MEQLLFVISGLVRLGFHWGSWLLLITNIRQHEVSRYLLCCNRVGHNNESCCLVLFLVLTDMIYLLLLMYLSLLECWISSKPVATTSISRLTTYHHDYSHHQSTIFHSANAIELFLNGKTELGQNSDPQYNFQNQKTKSIVIQLLSGEPETWHHIQSLKSREKENKSSYCFQMHQNQKAIFDVWSLKTKMACCIFSLAHWKPMTRHKFGNQTTKKWNLVTWRCIADCWQCHLCLHDWSKTASFPNPLGSEERVGDHEY